MLILWLRQTCNQICLTDGSGVVLLLADQKEVFGRFALVSASGLAVSGRGLGSRAPTSKRWRAIDGRLAGGGDQRVTDDLSDRGWHFTVIIYPSFQPKHT